MCFVDLDPAELWTEHERKARKPHTCACCHGTIKAGEFYLVHFSVFEGSPTSEKMCLACKADRAEFAAAHNGMLHTPSWHETALRNCIGDSDNDEQWRAMLGRILARRAGDPAPTPRGTDGSPSDPSSNPGGRAAAGDEPTPAGVPASEPDAAPADADGRPGRPAGEAEEEADRLRG